MVDTFFWLSAFIASYNILTQTHKNPDSAPSYFRLIFGRFIRLAPLYYFILLFFWRFMVLMGGDGPMFFGYEHMNHCEKHWMWHMAFLNNIIPWKEANDCVSWTWFIACDLQFFMMLPFLVDLY